MSTSWRNGKWLISGKTEVLIRLNHFLSLMEFHLVSSIDFDNGKSDISRRGQSLAFPKNKSRQHQKRSGTVSHSLSTLLKDGAGHKGGNLKLRKNDKKCWDGSRCEQNRRRDRNWANKETETAKLSSSNRDRGGSHGSCNPWQTSAFWEPCSDPSSHHEHMPT